jgi:hypothetical protein
MKWRNLILTAGILVLIILLGFLVCIAAEEPDWSKIETEPYTDDGFDEDAMFEAGLADVAALSYDQKFDKAVSMLSEEGIEDLGEYLIVVDESEQKEYVYRANGDLERTYKISMKPKSLDGAEDTEEGSDDGMADDVPEVLNIWKVVSKVDSDLIPLYGARLIKMDRRSEGEWITSGIALHGTNTPEILGTPESIGCVYHSNVDIIALYELIDIGTYVVVIR